MVGAAMVNREGMEDIQVQIRELQTSVRRQRLAIFALASILTSITLLGGVPPAGDATFNAITCKEWKVVDKDGKERIRARTAPDGTASVWWFDKDGKRRIGAVTLPNGVAGVSWRDQAEKERINAATGPDGGAILSWWDNRGKERINAGTDAAGMVALPTQDLK
jgi:hypothetical protein